MQQLLLIVGLFINSILLAQDTARADATIREATVYFGYGAELTHQSTVKVGTDTRLIVISPISTSVDINSLQISCPEDVSLLSHRYSLFRPAVPQAVRSKDQEKLEDSIDATRREGARIDNLMLIEQEVLTKTGVLIEATMSASGSKTITSAEVVKLVDYYSAKIERSKTNIFNYRQTRERLTKRLAELEERFTTLQGEKAPEPAAYGQLTLQVLCRKSGEIPVALSYYTTNAGWTPVYDIRVNSKTNKVKLIYKASLTQTTGIDWKKTKLSLSTGTPNFGVTAPILSPWYLQLYVPELYRALQGRAAGLNITRNTIQSMANNSKLSEVVITGYGSQYQQKESNQETIDPSTLQQYTTLNEGQLNTSFDIDLPYDVESDGQLHSVTIRDQEIDCSLKNYGVPRMDKEAYLLAEVVDWQNLDLLPGEANIIMDETYIGKSMIDPNTTADTLNLSLGKDKRLAIKRSLVKELSSLKTNGGNNKQTFTYELTVKNNKLTDVNLLLKDQYPLSTIKEVEVKMDESGEAAINEETGVLTWKVSLKPGESRKMRFSYTVKYPKDKKIINLK